MAEPSFTTIDNFTRMPSLWNSFKKPNVLSIKLLDGFQYSVVCMRDKVLLCEEGGTGDKEILAGEVQSLDNTDSDVYAVLKDGSTHRFSLAALSPVPCFPSLSVVQVACGCEHVLLLTRERVVYSFGRGPQTGLGEECDSQEPRQIEELGDVISVHAGARHSVAVVKSGRRIMRNGGSDIARKKKSIFSKTPTRMVVFRSQIERCESYGQLCDTKLHRYTDDLLEIKKLNALPCPRAVNVSQEKKKTGSFIKEVDNEVMVWGHGDNHQLGLKFNSHVTQPTRLPGVTEVIDVACGALHTTATTADGELLIWGNFFPSTNQKTRGTFESPTRVARKGLHIMKVMCGEMFTIAVVYKRNDECPNIAVVKADEGGPSLQMRDIEVSDKILQSVSVVRSMDKGIAIFQTESKEENGIRRKLHTYCCEMKKTLEKTYVIQKSFSIKRDETADGLSPLLKGLIELIGMTNVIFKSSLAVVQWLVKRTSRLPIEEMIEDDLLRILDEHRGAIVDFLLHFNYLKQFTGFKLIDKALKDSTSISILSKKKEKTEDLFTDAVPSLTLTSNLLLQFSKIDKDHEGLKDLADAVRKSMQCLSESKVDLAELREHFSKLPKEVIEKLFLLGGRHLLISGPKSSRAAPIRVRQVSSSSSASPADVPVFDGCSVFLTSKAIIFYKNVRNNHEVTEWKLHAMWMMILESHNNLDGLPTMVLTFPETVINLVAPDEASFETWKSAITDAIHSTFGKGPLEMKNIEAYRRRKFFHTYMFGPKKSFEFDGEWMDGLPHGFGEMRGRTDNNVEYKHSGEFWHGLRHGFGTSCSYHENERNSVYMEERCGFWHEDKMDGFGMAQYHYKEQNSNSPNKLQSSPLFKGHFKDDKRSGYGVCEIDDEIYLGSWENDVRSGEAVVISFKDGQSGTVINCRFENDNLKMVNGSLSGHNFSYVGNLNDRRLPDGQGTLTYIITKTDSVEITGDLHMHSNGVLEVKNGTVKTRRTSPDSMDLVFNPVTPAEPSATKWASLAKQCLCALHPLADSESSNLNPVELSKLTWTLVMKKVISTLPPEEDAHSNEISTEESVDYFLSLVKKQELTAHDLKRMEALMQKLNNLKHFPISVFISIRTSVLAIPVGLSISEPARLQTMVIADLNELLVELYSLLRHLFPALPADIKKKIPLTGSEENLQGIDFVYSCLPSNVYAVLTDVISHPCQSLDRRFREELNKRNLDANFLDQLQIANRKLLSVLREEEELVKREDFDPNNGEDRFIHCVTYFKSVIPDKLEIQSAREAWLKLLDLEKVCRKIEQFLVSSIGTKDVGADNFFPLLSYLIWRAKPSRFSFWLSFIEKLNSHRISGYQEYLLHSFYAAYTACCASATSLG